MCRRENNLLRIIDCGLCDFGSVLALQQQLCQQRRDGAIPDTVLIVEHKPVITLGANKPKNRLLKGADALLSEGVETVEIRRGGGATAHNPGQLVFYPILNIAELGLGVSDYVRALEQIGIELLGELGVESGRKKGFPGLWVGEKKIASIGVRVSRFITHHGMAININNDLSIFENMVPCGIEGVVMTSVEKELGGPAAMEKVKGILVKLLSGHFSSEGCVEYEKRA